MCGMDGDPDKQYFSFSINQSIYHSRSLPENYSYSPRDTISQWLVSSHVTLTDLSLEAYHQAEAKTEALSIHWNHIVTYHTGDRVTKYTNKDPYIYLMYNSGWNLC